MSENVSPGRAGDAAWVRRRVAELGPWFHDMELGGVRTAPDHFLRDYPNVKWQRFAHRLPADLQGRSVLDIGCNAGFYAIALKRRGAGRVLGIDSDPAYLAQARFAAAMSGVEIELAQMSVYDVGRIGARFDIVLFMGVLYHLRHPLLALDLIHAHVADDLLVFQSMQRGSAKAARACADAPFGQTRMFDEPAYPKLHFIEHRYAGDPTNWWVPNRACAEAMLRSAGFAIEARVEKEVYLARRRALAEPPDGPRAVYPTRGGERVEDVMAEGGAA